MDRQANLIAKATRLALDGKVRELPGPVFCVEGDHGTYLTAPRAGVCSCPARGICSHRLAAEHAASEADSYFADLEDAADELDARRYGDPAGAEREAGAA